MQNASNAYLQTQVTTTSQGEILVMLYDGAIKFMNRAKECLAARDMAGKGKAISRALDIINELDSTLNVEKGGELAKNLHNLYLFCSRRLLMANLRAEAGIVDEVLAIITGLRSAYAQIVSLPEAQAAAQEAAASQHAKAAQTSRAHASAGTATGFAPGIGSRAHSLYAQKSAELTKTAELPPSAPDIPQADGELSVAAPSPASQTSAAVSETVEPPLPSMPPAFAPNAGFAGRNALRADMYRKFAGQ